MNEKNIFAENKKTPKAFCFGRFSLLLQFEEMIRKMALIFAFLTLTIIFSFSVVNDALSLYKPKKQVTIKARNIGELCDKLYENGIIEYKGAFELYCKLPQNSELLMKDKKITVSSDMDYNEILSKFNSKPKPKVVRIKFPKGASTDEIIEIFLSKGIGTRDGFEDAINNYPFDYDFVKELKTGSREEISQGHYRLCGYLYPDSYDFYTGKSEVYYINKMLQRFDAIITPEIRNLAKTKGMKLNDAVIMASLLEKSCLYVAQYEYLSCVFHNRLAKDIYLECPCSMYKGKGVYTLEATKEMKESDSLYNTFLHKGLPKGSVCNPDKNALICALRPAKADYMYFVTDRNGRVLFAKDEKTHIENLKKVNQK